MKRDWDIIRKILIAIEENKQSEYLQPKDIQGANVNDVAYNMGLLLDAKFIEGHSLKLSNMDLIGPFKAKIFATSLSWSGHELLDSIRHDTTWNHIKKTAINKGLELTFDVVISLAKAYIASKVGTP